MSFSGFSEDDIRKLKNQDVNKLQKGYQKTSLKKVTFKSNSNGNHSTRTKTTINTAVNNISTQDVPENAKLNTVPSKPKTSTDTINDADRQKPEEKESQPSVQNNSNEKCEVTKEEKKYKDLDEFEAKQKLVEEQNRKRKELLAKALADRTKRTQEEAQKLNQIQEEFKKLDAMLSGDVKILRKQIELASIEYMECQKRYNRIEKEFLDAKLLMHQKLEKKEMLTEHLCTIIEKNEERKAEKLNELLERLQMSPTEADTADNNVIQTNTVTETTK